MMAARLTVGLGHETFLYGARLFWHNYDFFYSLMKAWMFGFIIPLISVHMGLLTRGGAEGVGRATTSLRRLHDHRRPGRGRDVPAPVPELSACPPDRTVIEYRNIHKTFDVPVLAGLSFTVETGETLAIVGPSGTGKSVLLKTTIGLIVPDHGDVIIDGQSVFAAEPRRSCRPSAARSATCSRTPPSSTP